MIRATGLGRTAALAALVPVALVLTACQPVATRLDSTSAQSAATETATAPGTPSANDPVVGSGSDGPGSITLAITSPRSVSGHADTVVSCTGGRRYHASGDTVVQGYTVHVNATAVRYSGPGTYPTTLSGTIVAPDEEAFALVALRTTSKLDDTGGSTSFSVTGSRGHTLAGSLSWTCS
jgi:hypothetical protein